MVRNVAELLPELEEADFYLLSGVEQGMRFSEWVQREKLPKFADLTEEEIDYRLERCLKRGLVEKKTIQYEGYTLQFEGYDALALRTLVQRETIGEFGSPLGVGKESDVYEVRSYKPLALKYHREGYTNFREVHKERDYTADREHVSWMYTARKAAEREYDILEALYPDVSVPRPIDQNRHAIVMEKMDGVELSRAKLEDEQVIGVLDLLLSELATAYEIGYVHADMSEYNVFVGEDGVTIFDWPQAVPTDHENASEFLRRDLRNLIGYFRRKYPQIVPDEIDEESVAAAIEGGAFETVETHV
ncbi:serine/threonine-protein kinase RIO2 [Natronobacterium gregoryi]|uniref:non-specific serine/threonine protein kinase n=2 Tax=Natronobacterium gregoryi TaxID=44930 RepID=L0AIE7_NATGS|nr:serine/threonine-protein kinase RIO2 [Natronobacterium gregoryi]AFZ73648.1 RIO-like serine/threonine protein kinase fused to N-terminal HTH domain protein [Natronobacterium gregoryi SP2]ELY67842.1 Non-specific serine/threonine protein kinase [Natronobacterium gregoryi SP2]PLK19629.1 serine/threonine protein phosphatase [Natronobacterium gregoryi SP2]SFJ00213.1 RIO kinase 2 [Natronobacterium gregoryi]